VYIVILLW